MTLRIGLAGTGVMGRCHARNIAALWPRARLVAVADSNAEAAQSVAAELECDWYTDAREMFARPDLEAVVIATGADTHAALAIEAAVQKKDVLVEKPMALTVEDAREAAHAADCAGVRLQVGFMRRYDPAYRQAYDAIVRGDLGTPVLLSAVSRDAESPPRSYFSSPAAAGLFLDSGVHDFDLARWLLRDDVTSVSATGALVAAHDLADVQPIDVGIVTLRLRGGALATIQLYRNAVYGYDIKTEVIGTEGTVMVGDHRWRAVELLRSQDIRHTMPHHWLERFAEAYALEMADWVHRMSAGEPPAVTAEDGIGAVAIAVAAERSRLTGQDVAL